MRTTAGDSVIIEPRWPVALANLSVVALVLSLPGYLRLFPWWFPYVMGFGMLLPMVVVGLSRHKERWLHIERVLMLAFILLVAASAIATLTFDLREMVSRTHVVTGGQLLASSIGLWVINVANFSLLYWYIDRGGPEARRSRSGRRPDWQFPQDSAADAADFCPIYLDYLFLGFTTAMAFSPTDTLPLSRRAKVFMMLEAAFALITLVVVAARAINILGP